MTTLRSFAYSGSRPGPAPTRWLPWMLLAVVGILWATVAVAVVLFHIDSPDGPRFPFWPVVPFGLFLLFLTVFVVFRSFGGWGCGWGYGRWGAPGAGDFVRDRYARGEIDAEQMRRMLHELAESGGAA